MSNVIQDGTFLLPIQINSQNIYQWTDWTGAGITTQNPAPSGIPGDYASLPVGGDLFEDFNALTPGNYSLSFYVENQSPWDAKLVLAVQQHLGTPISELFAAGTAEELSLPASMTSFVKETFNFTITPGETFIPQELYFSNSYNAPIPPITNSINPAGTIVNIADVSLTQSPSLTINPIDNDTNVITAVDAASPITVSGNEAGLDGQDIFVTLFSSTNQSVATVVRIAANGTWSAPLTVPQHLTNGTYALVAENSDGSVVASESVTVNEIYSNVAWARGRSGDFATASNWNPAEVPGPANDVTIGVKGNYTVTSAADEIVDNLIISNKHAALFITGPSTFATTTGGVNNGTISADNGSELDVGASGQTTTFTNLGNIDVVGSQFVIAGDVSLHGNGNANLSGGEILGFGTLSTDNTISGSGTIGNVGGPILTNDATGVIDANDSNAPLIIDATPVKNTSLTNAGLLEATHGGTLLLSGIISNTTTGTVEADHGSTIGLEGGNIFGGTVTVLHGATIEAEQAAGTIFAAVLTNAGTIGAEGANLEISSNLTNTGTLDATNARLSIDGDVNNTGTLNANNGALVIEGAVSGGKATIEGTGEIEFGGASSANVTFAANSAGILKLDHQSVGDPSAFTGAVSGLNTGGFIDVTNINFADNPTLSYSSKTHVLTVTDNVSHVTDTITFKGAVGSFSAQSDGSGGTFITDPPPATTNMVTVSHDSFVFASTLGENGGKDNVQHNEPIDFLHQGGELVDLTALMIQAHAEGAHLLAAPDAIDMHHAAALAAHHFSV